MVKQTVPETSSIHHGEDCFRLAGVVMERAGVEGRDFAGAYNGAGRVLCILTTGSAAPFRSGTSKRSPA